jgi:hypothetical protein
MSTIRLATYVSSGEAHDWGCYARLDLRPECARTLLLWRTKWAAVEAVAGPHLYAVRAWDSRVCYYNLVDLLLNLNWTDEVEGDWSALPTDADDFSERHEMRTDGDAVEVDGRGISWRAYAGDILIETAGLTWEQLEAIAAGRDPFAEKEAATS